MKYYAKVVFTIIVFAILLTFYVSAYGFVYTSGPSGGYGGGSFSIWPAAPRDQMKISEIRIRAGSIIDSIQVVYKYKNGVTRVDGPFGGAGGQQYVFKLDDDEYIKRVFGSCDNLIRSIGFVTNKGKSQMYGGNGGNRYFWYDPPDNIEIAGFFGRSGLYVDAIGVYYRIVDQSKYVGFKRQDGSAFCSGGNGGAYFKISRPYDYEDYTISKIDIWADNLVNGIQVTYRHRINGYVWAPSRIYGNMRGHKRTFLLDANEYLTAISGKYGAVIDSIVFETNKKTSPKYGGSGGAQWYRYEAPKESIINGFIGYYGNHIDSIGVIIDSIFPNQSQSTRTIITTPKGTEFAAEVNRELAPDVIKKVDQEVKDLIKIHRWRAYILSMSTATYNCHGFAWHGIQPNEKYNFGYDEIQIYLRDGSYFAIEESEATWGDIIYYPGSGTIDHSAIITNKTEQGFWCISKWGQGPLVGHLYNDCPNYKEGQNLEYYRRNDSD